MPMYSFRCEDCGRQFDELVSFSRRSEVRCPVCKGPTRVLVSSCAAVVGGCGGASQSSGPRFT